MGRCFDFVARMMAAAAASKEWVMQKIAEAQLSGGEVDLSAYPVRTEVQSLISPVSNAANVAQAKADENSANLQNALDRIAALETLTTPETVTITPNEEYISAWNAVRNYRDTNTLTINGNFRISNDIPGGTVLFTLPYNVGWAYAFIKHSTNLILATVSGNEVKLSTSFEMLKTTQTSATIILNAVITGEATAAMNETEE